MNILQFYKGGRNGKTKKILMIVSLSALAVACIMLILAVFKLPIFDGVPLRILLIVGTVAISCGIAINEVSVIKRKKILGYVGLGLLGISDIMALVIFCSKLLVTYSVLNRITGIGSISSVLFIVAKVCLVCKFQLMQVLLALELFLHS